MVKKMNLSEKRKLERRLPLWESAYTSALPSEKKELILKIEDARLKLGMVSFLEKNKNNLNEENKKTEVKNNEPIENYPHHLVGEKIKPEYIVLLKNKYNFKDKEICDFFGISIPSMTVLNKKHIGKRYSPIKCNKFCLNERMNINPNIILNLKRNGMKDADIAENLGVKQQTLSYYNNKYIKEVYRCINLQSMRVDYSDTAKQIAEMLNNGLKISEMHGIGKDYGQRIRIFNNYIECYYELKKDDKLNVERYCDLANYGFKDYEIAEMYGIHKDTVKYKKKEKIKVEYFLK